MSKKPKKPKKPARTFRDNLREKYQPLYDKLVTMIEDLGDWNMNYNKIAAEWEVPKSDIYRWKDNILSEKVIINPNTMGNQIVGALKTAIKQCQLKVRMSENDADKARYMNTLANLSDSMTNMLEKYGHKEKVADKHLIFGAEGITVTFVEPEEKKLPEVGDEKKES